MKIVRCLKREKMKTCSICLLPECYPNISFDGQGICNYCREYKSFEPFGVNNLKEIFHENTKLKKAGYDCIVPISGGRDSAFVLHQVVRIYNKKTLAYHYDNGFSTEQATANIRNITDKLGVDLVIRKSVGNLQVRMMRENFKLNSTKTPLHVLRDICNGCRNGYKGGAYTLARGKGIPIIVFGDSRFEESIYKKVIFKPMEPNLREKIANVIRYPFNFVARQYYSYLFEKEFPLLQDGNIKILHFFDYEAWDEDVIVRTIRDKTGWSSGNVGSTWRIDCKVHALVDYLTYKELGYNEKDELYSKLVRDGKLERDVGLDRIKKLRENNEAQHEMILRFFEEYNLDVQYLNKIKRRLKCAE